MLLTNLLTSYFLAQEFQCDAKLQEIIHIFPPQKLYFLLLDWNVWFSQNLEIWVSKYPNYPHNRFWNITENFPIKKLGPASISWWSTSWAALAVALCGIPRVTSCSALSVILESFVTFVLVKWLFYFSFVNTCSMSTVFALQNIKEIKSSSKQL